jgi:hypothetical protein
MEVAVESRPKFPQQGLLGNKAGRVQISNSHRCREALDGSWVMGKGLLLPLTRAVFMHVWLKGAIAD